MRTYTIAWLDGLSAREIRWQDVARAPIDLYPWPDEGYHPEAYAQVVCLRDRLVVRVTAREREVRCEELVPNTNMCWDSCLEFFVNPMPGASDQYLNFEITPLGVLHLAIGSGRHGRVLLPEDGDRERFHIEPLRTQEAWQVTYQIPFDYLARLYPGFSMGKGSVLRANFYKCGDKSKHPHHGTFAPIDLPKPDFHRPEFFTELTVG